MQLRVRHIARNVIFNWAGTLVGMAIGFFLSPFILHRLGDVAYGVWVLAVSAVGYLNLLDLGMQNAVLRFVSRAYTQGNHEEASESFSAAFWVRLQISAVVLLCSGILAWRFPTLFHVPAQLASTARIAIMLIGASAATSMSIGVYGGVLSGLNRYDLQNYIRFVQNIVRVVGVVTVLRHGKGIVAIALCELAASLVGNLLLVVAARRLYPQLRTRLQRPRWSTLRSIWSYSGYVFLTGIVVQLVNQTDNLVVGAFVSTAAVTFYAIGNSLCRYTDGIISNISTTLVPAASTYDASGSRESLRGLYIHGTRATLMLSLPILLTLIFRGETFIGLWMGPRYAHTSGWVLILLASAMLFGFANRTPGAIAFGTDKHKVVALMAIAEGLANLALSIILVHYYGIYGVAIGTVIPNLLVHLIFWPWYIPRLVDITTSKVLTQVWLPVMLAAVPFAIASVAVDKLVPVHSILMFLLQVAATLPIFLVPLAIIFRGALRTQVLPRFRQLAFRMS